ncbi:MAG: hypothetical protein NHB32_13005 [Fischerella sp. CENA71]|nr:hypothetical protein [Fischerella sp. CENA71]
MQRKLKSDRVVNNQKDSMHYLLYPLTRQSHQLGVHIVADYCSMTDLHWGLCY